MKFAQLCKLEDALGSKLNERLWGQALKKTIKKNHWCQATVFRYWHGLTRDGLCHILDLKDGYGTNFPGETFRVLKEK